MDKEVQEKIFEPFFTTKEKEKGTGLGLSTVFGIIKQHNGFILAYSEPCKGSVFRIYLPVVQGASKKAEDRKVRELRRGDETILIVDDEILVLSITKELLEELNYTVLDARSGEEGIAISEPYEGKIDLLLTDVVMTGINGFELAKRVVGKRPEIKCLFASGYMENPIVLNNIAELSMPFITKPFTPQTLTDKIRDVLDEKLKKH